MSETSNGDHHMKHDAYDVAQDRAGTPVSCNRESNLSSKSRFRDIPDVSFVSQTFDTPQQALVSRSVTVGTSTPKISSLSSFPNNAVRHEPSNEVFEDLEAETSSVLLSRFRRSSPLSWRGNEDADVPEPPLTWQSSGGTGASSIPVPTAIKHSDRQFSIESLLSIGSFDSIHQSTNTTPLSRRGSLPTSPGACNLERAVDDLYQQNLGGLRPLILGRESSLASLGDMSSTFKDVDCLKPSLLPSGMVKIDSPISKEYDTPTNDGQSKVFQQNSCDAISVHTKPTRDMMLQNNARAAAGLPPLPFEQEGDAAQLTFVPGAAYWNAMEKPVVVDRVSSANANWEMYRQSPSGGVGSGPLNSTQRPARPTHLKNRGRSRSNVTFSDPPAVDMEISKPPGAPVAAPVAPPALSTSIRKPSEAGQGLVSSNASVDWSHNSTSTANTSPSAIKELPTSALQEWLSSGTPTSQKDQASPPNVAAAPVILGSEWKPWGPSTYNASAGSYDSEMFPPYPHPGMVPPYLAHGNLAYAVPMPMMWNPHMSNERSTPSNRGGIGPGQAPKRYVSAGPYPPYQAPAGFNNFPPVFPYKRSASAPEDTGNVGFAQKWAKSRENGTTLPARVKRDRSVRDGSDRQSKFVQFGHPHVEILEGRRIYSRHTLFLLGAHRSDILAVNGNNVDGCDSILLFNNGENPQRKDDLAMLKYGCSSRSGGSALYASHVKNLPVRVFRKFENGKSQGFRYDGLYGVIAMFDESGSPRSELPALAHERVEFLLRRNPQASATIGESSSAFNNRLGIEELWDHVSKTLSGVRQLSTNSSCNGRDSTNVLPEPCDSSSCTKRPHNSSLQKSKSESNPQPSRLSRPAALNTRPRATSAEVALLHIRYFSPDDDEEDSNGNGHENLNASGSEHLPTSKRQKQSHKSGGELSPEMISDAIGRLLHPEGTSGGGIEASIQKTTVALPPEGVGRGLF